MEEDLARAAGLLAGARRVVVSTGAGMSKESGIPTFRDSLDGLWSQFGAESLASEAGFRANPRRVWAWYAGRRRRAIGARPHPGYHSVTELQRILPVVTIVTQNVDGLHAEAGAADVVELHGNLRRVRCLDGGHPFTGEIPGEEDRDPPSCPVCGSPLRPDVVWFGEQLPEQALARALDEARRCDALLLVGTSSTVWPAAQLPQVARSGGASIIEVNPEPSGLAARPDVFLQGPAGVVLPALLDEVRAQLTDR